MSTCSLPIQQLFKFITTAQLDLPGSVLTVSLSDTTFLSESSTVAKKKKKKMKTRKAKKKIDVDRLIIGTHWHARPEAEG